MKKVTIQDFRIAMLKVTDSNRTSILLKNLSDDELFKSNIELDLHVYLGNVRRIIEQLGKDKRVPLPNELHKVLPDCVVSTLLDTVNFCLREEEKLGINVDI